MSKKQEFIKYVNELMNAAPQIKMNEEATLYWETFSTTNTAEKPMFTDNGKLVLRFLQTHDDTTSWKSRDIAEELFISSRTVSGAMRKLVNDGFVEKMSEDPVCYAITEKGKNIKIED